MFLIGWVEKNIEDFRMLDIVFVCDGEIEFFCQIFFFQFFFIYYLIVVDVCCDCQIFWEFFLFEEIFVVFLWENYNLIYFKMDQKFFYV